LQNLKKNSLSSTTSKEFQTTFDFITYKLETEKKKLKSDREKRKQKKKKEVLNQTNVMTKI